VTMGTLGDRVGRRKLLLIGAAVFGAASILAAYASTSWQLIAARALLGVAGATLMPSTMALIRNMFRDPRQMGAAIGIWFSCFMGGMALGPLVGGILLEHFWWGSAFLLGVPFMVLLLVVGPVLLPEYRDTQAGRLDPVSVALSLAAILPLIYGLKELARHGFAPIPALALAMGLAVGYGFVRRQGYLRSPLLDLKLFRNRTFTVALATMLLGGVVMAGVSLMSTQYLQLVRALSPLDSGLWLLPQNVAMVAGSLLAPMLARRIQPAYVIALGLAIAGLGVALHTAVDPVTGLPLLVAGLVLAAFGISLPMAVTMNLMMGATPPEKAGSAASISETSGEFGIAMGIATLGTLGTVVYRASLPSGTTGPAQESLSSAVATGGPVVDAARDAFTVGLHAVGAVGAVIFLGLAVVSALTLRSREPKAPAELAVAH